MRADDSLRAVREAAELLRSARRVVIATGAGMSAESGVPTYRDEGGQWRDFEPFSSRGLDPRDVAHVPAFRARPERAWAFHEWIHRVMVRAEPHDGYAVVTRWVRETFPAAFVLTTNVDGLHLRAGVPEVSLCERYGSHWELQCLDACTPGQFWPDRRAARCALDERDLVAADWPRCPYCGNTARPRVLLDHDHHFVEKGHDWQRYENFCRAGEPDALVVIGTTLWFSWPEGVPRPRVVHINPDPATHERYANAVAISLRARDALVGIDWMMRLLG